MEASAAEIFDLSMEGVYGASEAVNSLLAEKITDSRELLRVRLLIEEVLLKYSDRFPDDSEVSIRLSGLLDTFRIIIRIKCDSYDPFFDEQNSIKSIMGSMMANSEGIYKTWKYRNGINQISLTMQKAQKAGMFTRIVCGVICGAAAGMVIRNFFPDAAPLISERILVPLTNSFTGLLCVMAVILCFCAILLGIVRMGDVYTFSTVGRRMVRTFLLVSMLLTLFNTAWIIPGMTLGTDTALSISFLDFFDLILSFVPGNIVSPFLEFNSVHIIIIAVMFGLSMLQMGERADSIAERFDEVNTIAVITNSYLNRFIPYYVGMMVCIQLITDQGRLVFGFLRLFIMVAAVGLLTMAAYTLTVSLRLKTRISVIVKKLMPPFMISLTSASSGAAMSTSISTLNGPLGIDKSFASLAYNLGLVLFRPGYCIVFTSCCLYAADMYNIEISWGWVLVSVVMSFILSIATPPVIGGTTVCFSILFSQLGIGEQALSVIISVNAILEFITVAVNNYCLESQIILLSDSLGKIDRDVLRKQ